MRGALKFTHVINIYIYFWVHRTVCIESGAFALLVACGLWPAQGKDERDNARTQEIV